MYVWLYGYVHVHMYVICLWVSVHVYRHQRSRSGVFTTFWLIYWDRVLYWLAWLAPRIFLLSILSYLHSRALELQACARMPGFFHIGARDLNSDLAWQELHQLNIWLFLLLLTSQEVPTLFLCTKFKMVFVIFLKYLKNFGVWCVPIHIFSSLTCLVPMEARWGCQVPWKWSYRWLWTSLWVLVNTLRSSGRVARPLNCCTMAPVPCSVSQESSGHGINYMHYCLI